MHIAPSGPYIALLGSLEVHTDAGVPVEVPGTRLRRLLSLLALHADQSVGIARLADGLWGTDPPAKRDNALQALISRLRRRVPGITVEARPTGYRLALPPAAVDVNRFESAVTTARRRRDDPRTAVRELDAALALWRGPALAEIVDWEPARAHAARLEELRLVAVEELIEARLALGEAAAVVPRLRELVVAHPLRERLTGQLIRALRDLGRGAEALGEYDRLRATLADSLGSDPAPEIAALHLSLLRGDPPPAPRPPEPDPAAAQVAAPEPITPVPTPPAHRLPAPLTSFVGRDKAVERMHRLLGRDRLLTLTGPGGAGKTRLAVEFARRFGDRFAEGVRLVELARVDTADEVPLAVLGALGLREQALVTDGAAGLRPGQPCDPVELLVAALAHRALLLVLDNCEHLLDPVAVLTERLLTAAAELRVLTTSREPLGLTGEVLLPVEPLPLPPPAVDVERARAYPSVRLFTDSAEAVRPGFALDATTVEPVVRICRALDGIPLAIELAAARLRAMTPAQVARRLDDRFRLLAAGSRTALPRHRTLRALIDWSWDLLDEAEQALLRRLAVFSGGAAPETIRRVCAGGAVDPADVPDWLAALVEKSLVVIEERDGEVRYRLLQTIREYGLERLREAGESYRFHHEHAVEYLTLAQRAEPWLRTAQQLTWLHRLDAEQDNLHAALRWALTERKAALAVRLAVALGWYWWLRGQRGEGGGLTEEALLLANSAGLADDATALAYATGAMLLAGRADPDRTSAWLARSAEMVAQRGIRHPLLRLVGPMLHCLDEEPTDRAGDAFAQLVGDPDPWLGGVSRLLRAQIKLNAGARVEDALADLADTLTLLRRSGDRWGISIGLYSLADLAARRGDHAAAIADLEQAIAAMAALGATEDIVQMRCRLAQQYWLTGARDRGWATLAQAEREAVAIGSVKGRAAVGYVRGELLRAQDGREPSDGDIELFTDALAGEIPLSPHWRAMLMTALGHLALGRGQPRDSRRHLDAALEVALATRDVYIVSMVLAGYADLAMAHDQPRRAAELLGAADAIRGGADLSALDALRVAEAARVALGAADFTEAYARGRARRLADVPELVGIPCDEPPGITADA